MKKLSLLFIAVFCVFQTYSQKLNPLDVINSLMKIKVITEYKNFKKDIENAVMKLTKNESLKNRPVS